MHTSAPSTASWALPRVARQPAMPLSTSSPELLLAVLHVQLRSRCQQLDTSSLLPSLELHALATARAFPVRVVSVVSIVSVVSVVYVVSLCSPLHQKSS